MNVTTRSYDNSRSGANLSETVLTADAVKALGIAKLFSLPLPGDARGMEAQPLVLQGVMMPDGSKRDVVYCATMANQVWAYDLNDGTLLWERTLGRPINGSKKIDFYQINDHWGILSTPVIDPEAGILYAVPWISADGSPEKGIHYLAALDVRDGSLKRPLLNLETCAYRPGHGLPVAVFKSAARKQRPALLLTSAGAQGTVFIAFGSLTESTQTSRGWVLAVDIANFTITAWSSTARGSGGGIWQAGAGPAADADGNIYLMTGNGDFDAVTDWGESFLKLAYAPPVGSNPGRIWVADWWTPWTDQGRTGGAREGEGPATTAAAQPSNRRVVADAMEAMDMGGMNMHGPPAADMMAAMTAWGDMDLGSGGPVLAPGMVLGAGKDGVLYPVNQADMGKTGPKDLDAPAGNYAKLASEAMFWTYYPGDALSPFPDNISTLNVLWGGKTHHQHGSFVVWRSPDRGMMAYCMGENGTLRAWAIGFKSQDSNIAYLAEGEETASWGSIRPPGGMPGGMACLSANGMMPGTAILWVLLPERDANSSLTRGRLIAYDATRFETRADGSMRIAKLWDSLDWGHVFTHPKFNLPVVCAGKVLVPTYDGQLLVYSLTPAA